MAAIPTSKTPRGAASFNENVTAAIIEAVLTDLAEKGLAGMSMDGVARRAGVGKSAIYRRWSSKEQMTAAILREVSWASHPDRPNTGSLRTDLQEVMLDFINWLTEDPRVGQIFLTIIAEGKRNQKIAEVLSTEVDTPRRKRVSEVFEAAIARGEIAEDYDQDLAMDILAGTVFWHLLARRRDVTPAYIDQLIDVLEATWTPAS